MTTTTLANGQTSTGQTLAYGDTLIVGPGGTAQSVTVRGGTADLRVQAGGQVSGTVMTSGFMDVQSGATATNTSVSGHSYFTADAGATINGLTITSSDSVMLDNDIAISGLSIAFQATVDLFDLPYAAGATATLDRTTDILTVASSGATYTLPLVGNYAGETFTLGSDSGFGSLGAFYGTNVTVVQATTSNIGQTVTGSGATIALAAGATVTTGPGGNTVNVTTTGTVLCGGPDTVRGGTGATNVVTNGAGATVVGGAGALTVHGSGNGNTVFAGAGGLTYIGGVGSDVVVGLGMPMTVTGGSGGGQFFGGGNATITAGAGGKLNIEIGGRGDKLYAAGPSGVLFGTVGGDILMSSANDTATSVFFGANGTGHMTFVTGAAPDLLALGQGTNTVTLGSGHDTIFGNGGTSSMSNITAGTGSLDLAFSGANTLLNIAAGNARNFNLYAYVQGPDTIHLTGYTANEAANAIATQHSTAGGTQLTLSDNSVVSLLGVQTATAALFS